MRCPRDKCGYEWEPRTEKPKACPMCKRYIKQKIATAQIPATVDPSHLIFHKQPDDDFTDTRTIVPFDEA